LTQVALRIDPYLNDCTDAGAIVEDDSIGRAERQNR